MKFTKLFSSILDSTVWQESKETRLVWVTMLAMVDRYGEVRSSLPGLAVRAGVTIPECQEAINRLSSPDPYSSTKTNEGRRIREIDGGWELLNHAKYSAMMSAEERRAYNTRKQAEYRAKAKACQKLSTSVSKSEQCQHIIDVDVDNRLNSTNALSLVSPAEKQKRAKKDNLPNDEWLIALRDHPSNEGLDVMEQYKLAKLWIDNHPPRQFTRKFFLNWLLKADRSLATQSNPYKSELPII